MGDDRRHMLAALDLAARGAGMVAPNPTVGCVLVKDGAVIAEGWHKGPGLPHAEAEALAAAGSAAKGATAYVTLEPCNHFGRTPPCADALIAAGVSEVVYAIDDPHTLARGGGTKLRAHGVTTRSRICAEEATHLNRFWLHTLAAKRPYTIAKFAMSLDGKIATRKGESKWITGPLARERAHDLRRMVDAIVVGARTVIADDPSLTARGLLGVEAMPLRVVMDSTGRTPLASAVYDRAGKGALLAATRNASPARLDAYRALGVDAIVLDTDEKGRPDAAELLSQLKQRGACGVLVEGGAQTLGAFFDGGLIDEVWAFIAPVIIGSGRSAVDGDGAGALADALRLHGVEAEQLGGDLLLRGFARAGTAP